MSLPLHTVKLHPHTQQHHPQDLQVNPQLSVGFVSSSSSFEEEKIRESSNVEAVMKQLWVPNSLRTLFPSNQSMVRACLYEQEYFTCQTLRHKVIFHPLIDNIDFIACVYMKITLLQCRKLICMNLKHHKYLCYERFLCHSCCVKFSHSNVKLLVKWWKLRAPLVWNIDNLQDNLILKTSGFYRLLLFCFTFT